MAQVGFAKKTAPTPWDGPSSHIIFIFIKDFNSLIRIQFHLPHDHALRHSQGNP